MWSTSLFHTRQKETWTRVATLELFPLQRLFAKGGELVTGQAEPPVKDSFCVQSLRSSLPGRPAVAWPCAEPEVLQYSTGFR